MTDDYSENVQPGAFRNVDLQAMAVAVSRYEAGLPPLDDYQRLVYEVVTRDHQTLHAAIRAAVDKFRAGGQ